MLPARNSAKGIFKRPTRGEFYVRRVLIVSWLRVETLGLEDTRSWMWTFSELQTKGKGKLPGGISSGCCAFRPHPHSWWSWWRIFCRKTCGIWPRSVPGSRWEGAHSWSGNSSHREIREEERRGLVKDCGFLVSGQFVIIASFKKMFVFGGNWLSRMTTFYSHHISNCQSFEWNENSLGVHCDSNGLK